MKKKHSFIQTARSLKLEGPSDWSGRFDDYLYSHDLDSPENKPGDLMIDSAEKKSRDITIILEESGTETESVIFRLDEDSLSVWEPYVKSWDRSKGQALLSLLRLGLLTVKLSNQREDLERESKNKKRA